MSACGRGLKFRNTQDNEDGEPHRHRHHKAAEDQAQSQAGNHGVGQPLPQRRGQRAPGPAGGMFGQGGLGAQAGDPFTPMRGRDPGGDIQQKRGDGPAHALASLGLAMDGVSMVRSTDKARPWSVRR